MLKCISRSFFLAAALLIAGTAWAGEALWVDVRSADEFNAGHVPNAVNIPHTEIADRIGEVTTDKDSRIYLYCRSGRRASFALDTLEQMGFSDVINLRSLENAQETYQQLNPK